MRAFLILSGVLAAVFVATPAAADPAQPVDTADIVAVGANTTQYLTDDLATAYNTTNPNALLDSWDAVNPVTGTPRDFIAIRPGVGMTRPTGTNEALTPWENGYPTDIDAVFSDRDPHLDSTDNGFAFLPFAQDTLGYATSAPTSSFPDTPTSNAPSNLAMAQLELIYTCQATTWNDPRIGGTSPDTIHPLIPPSTSGTSSTFEYALAGVQGGVGSCVTGATDNDPTPVRSDRDAIEPFSLARYTTLDTDGGIQLNTSGFRYTHNIYDVTVIDPTGNIPARLQPLFGDGSGTVTSTSNWICGAQAQAIVLAEGFTALPASTPCGAPMF